MKILVDTNVLISAFVFGGLPRKLIYKLLSYNHTLVVTSYVDLEFQAKLWQKWPEIAESVYSAYFKAGFLFLKSTNERIGDLRDEKDIPILSDALHYGVNVILSEDKDFLEAGLQHPLVTSVSTLYDFLKQK